MKENIILFIIIGLFLITVIFFKNKEGFTSSTESTEAYNALVVVKKALADAKTASDKVIVVAPTLDDTTDFNTKYTAVQTSLTSLKIAATAFDTYAKTTSETDTKNSASLILSTATSAIASLSSTTTPTTKITALDSVIASFTPINPLTVTTDTTSSTTESDSAYAALTSAKTALGKAKTSATASFSTDYTAAKTAVDALKTAATSFNTKASTSTTETAQVKTAAKTLFDAATAAASKFPSLSTATDSDKSTAITKALEDLSTITQPTNQNAIGVVSGVVSGVAGTLKGDSCANKTTSVGCEWNNDKTDISDWWNEHRTHDTDTAVNGVKWNYHTIELGDYKLYPNCYRNPTDKTNGEATLTFINSYLKEREKEAKDTLSSISNYRRQQSEYDISMSKYKSILENNARTISSINEEKERYKRDISNASTRGTGTNNGTVYSDDYEYYYEEEGPDGATCPSLKCIADFGTNIGENLCCGQTGVLQNTEYVCPSVKPTCKNFKCGSKFGTCV